MTDIVLFILTICAVFSTLALIAIAGLLESIKDKL
jgi:hypothetical protein